MSITMVNCVLFELTEKLVLEAGLITPISDPCLSQSPRSEWAGSPNCVIGRKAKSKTSQEWKHCASEISWQVTIFNKGSGCLLQQVKAPELQLPTTISFVVFVGYSKYPIWYYLCVLLFVPLLKNLTKGVTLFYPRLSWLGAPPGYLKGASSVDFCWIFLNIHVMISL